MPAVGILQSLEKAFEVISKAFSMPLSAVKTTRYTLIVDEHVYELVPSWTMVLAAL